MTAPTSSNVQVSSQEPKLFTHYSNYNHDQYLYIKLIVQSSHNVRHHSHTVGSHRLCPIMDLLNSYRILQAITETFFYKLKLNLNYE